MNVNTTPLFYEKAKKHDEDTGIRAVTSLTSTTTKIRPTNAKLV